MVPGWDLQGGMGLALLRAASVAGQLWVFGALLFRAVVLPRLAVRATTRARLRAAERAGVALAVAGTFAWLVAQAATITGQTGLAALPGAVASVAMRTRFGLTVLAQLAAAAGLGFILRGAGRPWPPLALAAAALALQSRHGHAAAMAGGPWLLPVLDLVHLAAAGAWLGALPPLLLVVAGEPPEVGAAAARWFAPLGRLCVAGMALSSFGQGWVLAGGVAGLLGTAYGWMLLAKLLLFGALLGLALANRYRFAPALRGGDPAGARRRLGRSIAVQCGLGLATVAAAAVLAGLPPAMHLRPAGPAVAASGPAGRPAMDARK